MAQSKAKTLSLPRLDGFAVTLMARSYLVSDGLANSALIVFLFA